MITTRRMGRYKGVIMPFKKGDKVERLIDLETNQWEGGYTVYVPPEGFPLMHGPDRTPHIYIEKSNSKGFQTYRVGVPKEHLRHALNPMDD